MMLTFHQKGDFSKLSKYLKKAKKGAYPNCLHKYGRAGVNALAAATPADSGLTARSWYYEIKNGREAVTIYFCNSNIQNGAPIAVILQYGHGTGTGGWVEGRDYINPAVQPIFDQIAKDAWAEISG